MIVSNCGSSYYLFNQNICTLQFFLYRLCSIVSDWVFLHQFKHLYKVILSYSSSFFSFYYICCSMHFIRRLYLPNLPCYILNSSALLSGKDLSTAILQLSEIGKLEYQETSGWFTVYPFSDFNNISSFLTNPLCPCFRLSPSILQGSYIHSSIFWIL